MLNNIRKEIIQEIRLIITATSKSFSFTRRSFVKKEEKISKMNKIVIG